MPLVIFTVFERLDPRFVPADTRAVPAARYVHVDDHAGTPVAVTRSDIAERDIYPLGSFGVGEEVFAEGEPDDVLDDEQPAATRMWWRACIITGLAPGGST
jgi:hypothetical protein